ncbi:MULTISPECIES: hypothetical protein [Asticcacaulis]|uniref:hypothetical protein n=1 Tax=Asticcacaulis TaxID=76890 RepID=UPI001AEA751A|nr:MULTISPECIES: hypothetical protein [Asticcacaulis]MBP2159050.1 hypothetical protein [Asticcacaulis solisilvae]MDR6800095.1 hypothetical protein [Asticcacaulis sp. BE141]
MSHILPLSRPDCDLPATKFLTQLNKCAARLANSSKEAYEQTVIAAREVDMVEKKSEPATVAILPGVELTPEAQDVLNKQLSRKIVWSYKATRGVLIGLSLSPLLISVFFAWLSLSAGLRDVDVIKTLLLIIVPAGAAMWLFSMARRY